MRLESLRGNWVRVRVGSRKINRVYLKEPDTAVIGAVVRQSSNSLIHRFLGYQIALLRSDGPAGAAG